MKLQIAYLDGDRLLAGVLAGGEAVIRDQGRLNRINVFPVPDGDTGTNLASMMAAIARRARAGRTVRQTLESIADAALHGARGNSGLIFAQFFHGLSLETEPGGRVPAGRFGESLRRAVAHARRAVARPVEGTMLTILHDWAEAAAAQAPSAADLAELLRAALQAARRSLQETPRKLAVLARAGVVDAGGQGFVDFLEGVADFIGHGDRRRVRTLVPPAEDALPAAVHRDAFGRRYCAEALIAGTDLDPDRFRAAIGDLGDSVIVAGGRSRVRLHVHADDPAEVFARVEALGTVSEIKVDDCLRQSQAAFGDGPGVALVTDSACDLPPALLDEHRVHVLPFTVTIGERPYLDKLTLSPERFYRALARTREPVRSSQPSPAAVRNLLAFLASHARAVLVLTIGRGLSGLHGLATQAAAELPEGRVRVVDTRTLSAGEGLVVLRAAEALRSGASADEVAARVEAWAAGSRFYVDVKTLEFMVRGGRVSPLLGFLATLLRLKPIVSLDAGGKAALAGKSFTRRANMRKILARVARDAAGGRLHSYAVVHAGNPARAAEYARRLEARLGRPPAFVLELAPVVGVHNGVGAVGIALSLEEAAR